MFQTLYIQWKKAIKEMRGITRINTYALYLNSLGPCKGFFQQLVPAYKRHRHRYRIFTFSLPNQTPYCDLFISKSSSLPNISPARCAHAVLYHRPAPSLYQSRSRKGSCWSRTRPHTIAAHAGGSFPNPACKEHSS